MEGYLEFIDGLLKFKVMSNVWGFNTANHSKGCFKMLRFCLEYQFSNLMPNLNEYHGVFGE